MSSSKTLIDMRMKLSGGKAVVSGLTEARKETEKLGSTTSKTSKVTKAATGTTSRLTGAFKELGTHAKLAFGLVGAGALFGVENAIHSTEELSKTTTSLTRNLGFQNNVASRWGALAQAREISNSALTMSFGSLSSKMVEAARKGGTLLTPFHQMGISQEEVAKGAGNFQWGLMRVAKALGEEEGGAKRATAAKALLGRGYKELLPLFSEGSEGLQEQLHWADEFGVTLSGKTNEGLQDMIQAQRKNKVAMLGVEVSLTKFLMPAIEKGDDQLQEFIKTLNSPKLTAEQKIERIGRQFSGLEKDIIKIIEKVAPEIAEQSGKLGIVAAKSLGNAFLHTNVLGKLAISGYVFNLFGGEALAKAGAKKVGQKMGLEMGIGLAAGATGALIGYELWNHLSRETRHEIEQWAVNAGTNFINSFIKIINGGIEEINGSLNSFNPLGNLPGGISVHAPQIGKVGEVENPGAGIVKHGAPEPPGAFNPHEAHGTFVPGGPEVKQHRHKRPRVKSVDRGALFGAGDSRPIVIHVHSHVGGKEVAEEVLRIARKDRYRK